MTTITPTSPDTGTRGVHLLLPLFLVVACLPAWGCGGGGGDEEAVEAVAGVENPTPVIEHGFIRTVNQSACTYDTWTIIVKSTGETFSGSTDGLLTPGRAGSDPFRVGCYDVFFTSTRSICAVAFYDVCVTAGETVELIIP